MRAAWQWAWMVLLAACNGNSGTPDANLGCPILGDPVLELGVPDRATFLNFEPLNGGKIPLSRNGQTFVAVQMAIRGRNLSRFAYISMTVTYQPASGEARQAVKDDTILERLLCRDDERLGFDYLPCLSGVDMKDSFTIAYHLESIEKGGLLCLKVEGIDREDPKVPSISMVWPTANWHEREVFDLFGVVFKDHPDLKRILCAEDWVGHPLRRDYEFPTEYHGIPCEIEYMDRFEEG